MCDEVRDNGPLPQALAVEMIPVIRRIAYRLAKRLPAHVCIDDLISSGVLGLITAYRRFDPARGDDFRSYAEVRIRGAMIDELRASDPLSRDLRAYTNRTLAAKRTLESRLGRAASEAEIASEMGLSIESYRSYAARAAVGPTVSLDAPTNGETVMQVGDPDETPVDERLLQEQAKLTVRRAVAALPARLRQVIELYYSDERTLRDIGNILGVTESRVCQLQAEAVQKMRAHCARIEPDEAPPTTRRIARFGRQPRREARVAA